MKLRFAHGDSAVILPWRFYLMVLMVCSKPDAFLGAFYQTLRFMPSMPTLRTINKMEAYNNNPES
jgi:hypothetical protein